MNRLEGIAQHYWKVSYELRRPRGSESHGVITTEQALHSLNEMDRLRPENWRLREHMHVLKFDLIEGNSSWRDNGKESKPKHASITKLDVGNGNTT